MIPVSAILVTRNEAANIERTLRNLHGFVDEIIVVDSQSDDGTVELCRPYADQVADLAYEHGRIIPWIYQWALDNLKIRNDWVLILEADQRLSDELKNELQSLFSGGAIAADGFYIRRRQVFRGKPLRFGGYGAKFMLKLFRRAAGELDAVEQDTRVYVRGVTARLKGALVEENAKEEEILFYLQKHLRYADAFAREEYRRRSERLGWKGTPRLLGTPDERILWLKGFYYRSPLYVRPVLYFLYRYVLLLGFLDGKNGFIFHFLQAFWFRLVVDIRLEEIARDAHADRTTEPQRRAQAPAAKPQR
jgi:glycosyltransferase involved in cell wall biosynthesis